MTNKIENKTERILYLDILRIISIFAMMLLHICANKWHDFPVTSFRWQTLNVYECFTRFCVPVFIMISGALFLSKNRDISISKIYRHNLLRLVTAFIFWSLLYTLSINVVIPSVRGMEIDTSVVFKDFVTGHYHMWFIYTIIGLYILTPIFTAITSNKKTEEYFLILAFIFNSVLPLIQFSDTGRFIFETLENLNFKTVTGYGMYYVLGHYLHTYKPSKKKLNALYILAPVLLLTTIIVTAIRSLYLNLPVWDFYDFLLFNNFIYSAALFCFFKYNLKTDSVSDKIKTAVIRLSNLCFGMYLCHDFFIIAFRTIGLTADTFTPVLSVPAIAILVFILSGIAAFIISKIPVLNKYIM